MIIRALAPWYGCKRTLAPAIVKQLGRHRVYWEPFCGSMSVLFTKDVVAYETVNDLHGNLVNLARVVQYEETALELYGMVQRTLFTEDMVVQAREWLSLPQKHFYRNTERAYWYMVFSWMGLNGVSGTPLSSTGTFAVRYTQGGNGPTRWRSVAESIPDWHRRLQKVQILNRDAFEIIPRIEDVDATALYVDPPYLEKSSSYVHDLNPGEHTELARLLRSFKKARVVVSYYDHPALAELYPGWTKVPLAAAKSMANSSKREEKGRTEANEVLLVNGPSYDAPSLF